jgi:hypothetical protein
MFGLFKKKDPQVKVVDQIWITRAAKLDACRKMYQHNPAIVFIAWFEETQHELQAMLPSSTVLLARNTSVDAVREKMIVFVEHHLSIAEEQAVFKRLYLKEANVLSGLDEALFMKFNGEKTIELMRRMGTKEDEVISHSMISSSIRRAQQKIAKSTNSNFPATSQAKWFEVNPTRRT